MHNDQFAGFMLFWEIRRNLMKPLSQSVIRVATSALFIIAILIVSFYLAKEYSQWKGAHERAANERQVEISAMGPVSKPCSSDLPFQYTIKNNSAKTLNAVGFSLTIYKLGFSTPLSSPTFISDDKILKPGESWSKCFRAKKADFSGYVRESEIEARITSKFVIFDE